jgi:THO complex subunit 4
VNSQPKSPASKPKPATDKAGSGRRTARGGARGGRGRGGTRAGTRTKKTAEELDAEMVDYFQAPEGGAGASGAAPATGDTNMDDDVLVG